MSEQFQRGQKIKFFIVGLALLGIGIILGTFFLKPILPEYDEFYLKRFFILKETIRQREEKPDEEELKKEITSKYYDIDSSYSETNIASLIQIKNDEDLKNKRRDLVRFIWGEGASINFHPSKVEQTSPLAPFQKLKNLKSMEILTIDMKEGLQSIVYLFEPIQSTNRLLIYHEGRKENQGMTQKNIQFFLDRGYSLALLAPPLLGRNNQPLVSINGLEKFKMEKLEHLKFLDHPLQFFVEPVAAALNYAVKKQNYSSIAMTGLDTGGWVTTLFSALDDRITRSYPVGGFTPLFLRSKAPWDWGEFPETLPELYKITTSLELFIMASRGNGRKQLQIINLYDDCCYSGPKYQMYVKPVQETLALLGGGEFDLFLDESHMDHILSDSALQKIAEDFER